MSWKEIVDPLDKFTGFIDKNGRPICVGDRIIYRKRIRADYRWDHRKGCRYNEIPGYTKPTEVKVVGYGKQVKTFANKKSYKIEYINVSGKDSFGFFRIYRCDKVLVID